MHELYHQKRKLKFRNIINYFLVNYDLNTLAMLWFGLCFLLTLVIISSWVSGERTPRSSYVV